MAPSVAATSVTLPAPELTTVKIGVSCLEADCFTTKLAEVTGLYEKYGFTDAEVVYFEGAQQVLQAAIAGQVQLVADSPESTFRTLATELPFRDVASFSNRLVRCLFTEASVKTADDLKGKRVAVSGLGGQSHAIVVLSLKALGLTPDDVNMAIVGGQSARVAALTAGSVAAIPAECALEPELTDQGFNTLVRLSEFDLPYTTNTLSTTRAFIAKYPNTVLATTAANLEAVQLFFTDEEMVVDAFAEWRQFDSVAAKIAIDGFKSSIQRDLRWTNESYENVLEIVAAEQQELAGIDVTEAFTTEFLDQLEKAGLYRELGVPGT